MPSNPKTNNQMDEMLTGRGFLSSKWMKEAEDPAVQRVLPEKYERWKNRVSNTGVLQQTSTLWGYLTSGKVTAFDKTILIAGLLYIISPIDLIPDAIPVVGWLDDLGVAAFVLSHITKRLSGEDGDYEDDLDTPLYREPKALMPRREEMPQYRGGLSYQLEELRSAAEQLGATAQVNMADELAENLGAQFFRVMFVGRFNSGKSTLINAFLDGVQLPVGGVPTTKAIINVLRGQKAELYSEQPDGEVVLHKSIEEIHNHQDKMIANAHAFSLFLPATAFPGEMTFVDTPGLMDTKQEVSARTLAETPTADAVVIVLDALVPLSRAELDFILDLPGRRDNRKMFFVLNKFDRVEPDEQDQVVKNIEKSLKDAGLGDQRLFPLSAKNACRERDGGGTDTGFEAFRNELLRFLESGSAGQIRAERQRRIDDLRRETEAVCDELIGYSEMAEKDLETAKKKAATASLDARKAFLRVEENLSNQAELLMRRCRANLEDCTQNLFSVLRGQFNAAKKPGELPSEEALSHQLKDCFRNFADSEVGKIEEAWTIQADAARADLLNSIQAANMSMNVKRSDAFMAEYPGLILLGGLVIAWPITGIVTFTALALGTLLGQGYLSGVVSAFASHFQVDRQREALLRGLHERLESAKSDLAERFDQAIKALRDQTLSMLKKDLEARREGAMVPDTGPEAAKYAATARKVKQLLLTSK